MIPTDGIHRQPERRGPMAVTAAVVVCLAALVFLLGLDTQTFLERFAGRRDLVVEPAGAAASANAGSDRPLRTEASTSAIDAKPSAAAPTGRRGGLRILVTWLADQSPAVAVAVRIIPVGVADSRLQEREGITDGAGVLLVENLPPGVYAPETCFGGSTTATVESGRVATASIEIPVGAVVRGIVVDETRRVVAGADIWLSYGAFRLIGAVVARTGADGTFALRSVACTPLRHLGARGAGHAPSASAIVAADPGVTVDLCLELGRASGTLRGHVAARGGEPQIHALLVVGSDSRRELRLADGTRATAPPPIRARTDAQGDFVIPCAPTGRVPVLVRAPGCSPWRREVDLPPRGEVELAIDLEPGATLFGTVLGADRLPAAGVEIRIGDLDDPAGSLVRTAGDGSYRLEALAAGEFDVMATSRTAGKAAARLVAPAGEVVRWDPILTIGEAMTFQVVDERGAPLVGWTVEVGATIDGSWESRWGPTGSDGRFVAVNCPAASYALRVSEPGAAFAALQRDGVRPAAAETVIRIADALRATASIVGVVTDAGGTPVAGAQVTASRSHDPVPRTLATEPGTGRFRCERVPAGEYSLRVHHPGFPDLVVGPHAVDAAGVWDLGQLRFEMPGWLVLRLSRDDGAPVGRPGLHCRKLDSAVHDDPEPDRFGVARTAPLAAGRYMLYVYGEGLVSMTREVEVVAGQETTLDMVLRAGVHVRLLFLDPPGGGPPIRGMRFSMSRGHGDVAAEVELTRRPPAPFEWHLGLPPGTYRLQAITPDLAVHVSAEVVLRSGPDQPRQIEVQIR